MCCKNAECGKAHAVGKAIAFHILPGGIACCIYDIRKWQTIQNQVPEYPGKGKRNADHGKQDILFKQRFSILCFNQMVQKDSTDTGRNKDARCFGQGGKNDSSSNFHDVSGIGIRMPTQRVKKSHDTKKRHQTVVVQLRTQKK